MATYTFDKIEYGSNVYVLQDSGALQLTGGQVTGPVTFGDSVSIDEATLGNLVVNGSASFTNNIQANTINGVTVGNSPKFTDTDTKVTSSANHYTPSTASGNDKTASASGATAAWSIDVVKGITINTDGKGHITGLSVTSGKIPGNPNTDTKLQVAEVTSGTQYYPLVGTGTTAATRQYDTTGFTYKGTNGTTSAVGSSILVLGNSTGSGTANNKQAQLIMYGSNTKKATITLAAPSADIALALPTSGGTLALTSQLPSVPTTANSATTGITASTTANKITVGSHSTDYGVKAAGSGSFTSGAFSGGSGSFSATVSSHVLSFSHTHTAATHAADSHTHTAPTLGSKVPTVSTASATVSITDNGHTHTIS